MKKLCVIIATGIVALAPLALLPRTATAQGYRDHDHWHGDIHHFDEHDYGRWRGGSWYHGPHGGRDGWWWTVDGSFYFYPQPVYPYPDPYVPPAVIGPSPPVIGAPVASYYYCHNPRGYYPYVPECFGPWHRVAAAAPAPVILQPPVVEQPAYAPAPPPVSASEPMDIRDQDDRQLNAFAVELSHIDPYGPHASSRLKNLASRVESYRQALFHRAYNAMDILHDTEELQQRIAAARSQAAKHGHPAALPPAPVPPPPPQ